MINVRFAGESDSNAWDAYVHSHPDGSPYHLFAWGKAIEQAYNHKAYYFLAEQNQEVTGILPAIQLRFPFILNELVSLPFCDVGGCLSDNREVLSAILSNVLSFAKHIKANTIKLRGCNEISQLRPFGFTEEKHDKARMLLDLPGSSEILMQGFKSKLRSQINKAEKNDLIFQWGSENRLNDYYSVFSENMHALGSPVHARKLFKAVLQLFGGNAKMGLVYYQDKAIGAGLMLMKGNSVSIPWASTLRDYNQLAPNMLLYWNFLKYAADNGYTMFDFGRSSKGEGTYKFKAQWGAKPHNLEWHSIAFNDKRSKIHSGKFLPSRDHLAKAWQRVPLKLANYLGPKLRKFISL
jgi:FemAB-related protein (PEP-CTERM system-associated)